ncbi:PspA/IM30 family protein [Anaeromicropila populeti]|uniref:Phage shock protein A (PspA) family protein n=1 Tax=Anaeromicropila populeti TaxID=37658 RepID=A0A1I6IAW8_9FIRM|nr:PspA/IM30 family protein [Anaeromicropila populeti]SFR63816.1 phage shock protein A (PspA) family protein [Anaeromicropila populeti]
MGILTRFRDIMSANINALLDKAEDPEKMIDQCLRNLNSDLGKVKAETATVMAEEQRAKREFDECTEEMNKLQAYAIKALEAGNEADAKAFLEKKAFVATKHTELEKAYTLAKTNAQNMRAMHDKLVGDIEELESRRSTIKAKLAAAKTQERINKMTSSLDGANDSIASFERFEAQADKALDAANAMAELNAGPKDDIKELKSKYDIDSTSIDAELEALKASLNK